MWRTAAALVIFAFGVGWPVRLWASEPGTEEASQQLRSDSQAPYVHRITLYDHDGAVIDPTDEFAGPYSPRMTCAKCHDYAAISGGWHFNAGRDTVAGGRPGEPWILVDPQTGTQLAVSGRGWPGTYTPQEAGLTNWQFVLRFGAHTPGGDYGEPSQEVIERSPEAARWNISGPLEIDCMFCHSADQQHDPAEAARQIEKHNFKWAPTVALGLATVRGAAKELPDDWDPLMPADPNLPAETGPKLIWDTQCFDADDRVFFNIGRQPTNDRCYFCHSVRYVGPDAPPEWLATADVHLVAGLKCVDCHRNGIDHMMTRGYATEASERGEPALTAYSCEGCHLGVADSADPATALGGRYGALHPQHRGLPPLHFDKLTCTTCHSGPWPEMNATRFQTAMAHGLGLATRERTVDDPPRIIGPVFVRQANGRIAPQRILSAAYWGTLDAGGIHPLSPAVAQRAFSATGTNAIAFQGGELDRGAVNRVLQFLSEDGEPNGVPVYVANRWLHQLDSHASSASGQVGMDVYSWPLAHNVRPAVQSLGARGCTDCHDSGAPFFYGSVVLDDPPEGRRSYRIMNSFFVEDRRFGELLYDAWAVAFVSHPGFKVFALVCVGLIALLLVRYGLDGLVSLLRRIR